MGLDMYLTGHRDLRSMERKRGDRKVELIDLGYWRKHPSLHGFIVQTFAGGEDRCQMIALTADDLRKIIVTIEAGELPETSGFFFGVSDGSEHAEDLQIFREALAWLKAEADDWRSIYYQASW